MPAISGYLPRHVISQNIVWLNVMFPVTILKLSALAASISSLHSLAGKHKSPVLEKPVFIGCFATARILVTARPCASARWCMTDSTLMQSSFFPGA